MIIVITLPDYFPQEAAQICRFLWGEVDLVHIRKPHSSRGALERLIRDIPSELHSRLVLHDHHSLAEEYGLYGIHLNGRNPIVPPGWQGSVSRSCHSLAEVKLWRDRCNYVSLSPIFDSVSKQGYLSAFSNEQIMEAVRQGIIDKKVMALGGVTFARFHEVMSMGFGGGMILGDAWSGTQ